FELSVVVGINAFKPDRHGICAGCPPGLALDLEAKQTPTVFRLQAARRITHDLEIEVMHAGLVEDDVRELGVVVLNVLNPAVSDDFFAFKIVRLPEGCLVDPIRLLLYTLAEAKGFEHFHRSAGDAVSLAEKERPRLLLDNSGLNV